MTSDGLSGGPTPEHDETASDLHVLATSLRFPEGPVALEDGSILVAEIAGGTIKHVSSFGVITDLATTGGGPNGLAVGPDRKLYVCNNGGNEYMAGRFLSIGPSKSYAGGYIQRVDINTGHTETLYTHYKGLKLSAPNDIVFDNCGGFYFTDMGKKLGRTRVNGAVYYALCDGSRITEVAYPVIGANGIGLSPDNKMLYVSETETCRLWAFDIMSPGVLRKNPFPSPHGGKLICGLGGYQQFDSLAIDSLGNICIATLVTGYISVVAPDGQLLRRIKMPSIFPTNICFGGEALTTAFITLSDIGHLIAMRWPVAGLRLNCSA
jgi:gluconolactonase